MITLTGKFNTAHIYVPDDGLDTATYKQLMMVVNHPAFTGGRIAIMPDCHAGVGSCVGFTMADPDYIIPNTVGVDIGCGVLAVDLGKIDINFVEFDAELKASVPSGFNARAAVLPEVDYGVDTAFDELLSRVYTDEVGKSVHARRSCGSLGGGNHFIELDRDGNGHTWLVIHTGSRHLGVAVANYHNKAMAKAMSATGPQQLAYAGRESDLAQAYLADVTTTQKFAEINRRAIALIICRILHARINDMVSSRHNYVDANNNHVVVRKGAISARAGEALVLPMNACYGTVIGIGRGNNDWNDSAPHGAGRCMSRSEAKTTLDVADHQATFTDNNIFTTTANASTLAEAAAAYKPAETILSALADAVTVQGRLRPVYNFKAAS